MAVFLIIVILGVVLATISEAVRKHQDRKGWISGVEYDREVYGLTWITARVITDDEKEEFDVKYNPHDGHFYDRDNFGYHSTEILLKRHELLDGRVHKGTRKTVYERHEESREV